MNVKLFFLFFLIALGEHYIIGGLVSGSKNCFEKYSIGYNHKVWDYENWSNDEKEKLACAIGCTYQADSVKEGKTIHEYLIDNFSKVGDISNSPLDISALTRKANACANVGNDECKFMQCLDLYNQPWKSFLDALRNALTPSEA